jgi:hypothetical protein
MENRLKSLLAKINRSLCGSTKAKIEIKGVNISGTYVGGDLVVGNSVIIDGKTVIDSLCNIGPINIEVTGSLNSLNTVSGYVAVAGDVGDIKTTSGDVRVNQSCFGDVQTVSGDVQAGGNIAGNVRTVSGDIKGGRV